MIRLGFLSLLTFMLYGCGATEYIPTTYSKQTMSIQQAFKHCEFVANDDTRLLTFQYGKNYQMAWRKAYEKCMYQQGYVEQ